MMSLECFEVKRPNMISCAGSWMVVDGEEGDPTGKYVTSKKSM